MAQTIEDLRALCDLRAHLEGFAARRAALRRREGASVSEVERAQAALERAVEAGDPVAFHKADWKLHRAVARMAGVSALPGAWDVVADSVKSFSRSSLRRHWPDLSALLEEHRFFVQAIALGDAYAAEDAALSHLDGVWYRIAELSEGPSAAAADRSRPIPDRRDPLHRAIAYVSVHLARPLRLQWVAKNVAHVCPGHLSRLFEKRYGVGFQAYVQKLRLEKAAELLRHSAIPIGRVARRVGYTDVSRFGQHFKRAYERTPRAYRRAAEGERAEA